MNTVKEHILLNHGIRFHCNSCDREDEDLDLEQIMKERGPSFVFPIHPLCKCGSRDTGIRVYDKRAGYPQIQKGVD